MTEQYTKAWGSAQYTTAWGRLMNMGLDEGLVGRDPDEARVILDVIRNSKHIEPLPRDKVDQLVDRDQARELVTDVLWEDSVGHLITVYVSETKAPATPKSSTPPEPTPEEFAKVGAYLTWLADVFREHGFREQGRDSVAMRAAGALCTNLAEII